MWVVNLLELLLWFPATKLTTDQRTGANASDNEVTASSTKCVSRPISRWRLARAAMKKLTSDICARPAAVRLIVCSAAGLVSTSGRWILAVADESSRSVVATMMYFSPIAATASDASVPANQIYQINPINVLSLYEN